MTGSLLRIILAAGLLATTSGCDEDDDPLGPEDVAGSYTATTFTAATTDVLAAGGSIAVTLHANGTTTGQLFVPASVTGGAALTVDLAGTFALIGNRVRFDLNTASFVENVDFDIVGTTLRGNGTFGVIPATVVLTRTT